MSRPLNYICGCRHTFTSIFAPPEVCHTHPEAFLSEPDFGEEFDRLTVELATLCKRYENAWQGVQTAKELLNEDGLDKYRDSMKTWTDACKKYHEFRIRRLAFLVEWTRLVEEHTRRIKNRKKPQGSHDGTEPGSLSK